MNNHLQKDKYINVLLEETLGFIIVSVLRLKAKVNLSVNKCHSNTI